MNKEQLEEKVFFLTKNIKERILKEIKEPVVLSKCCYSEVDVQGGGYDGEDIMPIYDICKNCNTSCDTIVIEPKGWVNNKEIPF